MRKSAVYSSYSPRPPRSALKAHGEQWDGCVRNLDVLENG